MQSLLLRRKYYYSKNSVFGFRKQADFKNNPETLISNPNLLLLAQEYRSNAHLYADLNPLEKHSKKLPNSFSPSHYNLNDTDYVDNSLVFGIPSKSSIKSIVDHLHDVYSGQIAYEFQHTNEKIWFANKVESLKISLSNQERIEEMNLLSKSEVFDHFMAAKFPQVKRYGLEGAESMISALSRLFKSSSERGIHDIVLCMPHRYFYLTKWSLKFTCWFTEILSFKIVPQDQGQSRVSR